MTTEHWWNDTDRGKLKYCDEHMPSATLSTAILTWTDLGSNTNLVARDRRITVLDMALTVDVVVDDDDVDDGDMMVVVAIMTMMMMMMMMMFYLMMV